MTDKSTIIASLTKQFSDECHEDYEPMSAIVTNVKREKISDPVEIRQISLSIIRNLLNSDIVAGNFIKTETMYNFQAIDLPTEQIISFIDQKWTNSGPSSLANEIVWLAAKCITHIQYVVKK